MDQNTLPENQVVSVPNAIETSNTQETSAEAENTQINETTNSKPFWKRAKFIFSIIGLLILIGLILWLINVFNVYRQATVFKKSHDLVVKELQECDKIEGTTQTREIFNYCDQLKEKFKEVQR